MSMISGTLSGMGVGSVVGGVAGAIPIDDPNSVPASSGAPTGKTAAGGPVSKGGSGNNLSARETMYISVAYVIIACLLLGLGARVFRNARIA
jgi:hypothetical protein